LILEAASTLSFGSGFFLAPPTSSHPFPASMSLMLPLSSALFKKILPMRSGLEQKRALLPLGSEERFSGNPERRCRLGRAWSHLVRNHCVQNQCQAEESGNASWYLTHSALLVPGTCLPGYGESRTATAFQMELGMKCRALVFPKTSLAQRPPTSEQSGLRPWED